MDPCKPAKTLATARAAMLLLALLLFAGACSDDPADGPGKEPDTPPGEKQAKGDPTPPPTTGPETTGEPPPEVTLGEAPDRRPEVVIRLEGDPKTTFTGLCSVGQEQNVLSGRVPKRFTFDLAGERLECRIEKRDGADGDLKVVLVAGNTTRSVQQTNAPGGVINLSYRSE